MPDRPRCPKYFHRRFVLKRLGFSSYSEYLNSELWAEIRSSVLDRDGRKCKLCSMTAAVVHHIEYTLVTLRGDCLDSLVSLCRSCHDNIEVDENGRKRPLAEAMNFYFSLIGSDKRVLTKSPPRKSKRRSWRRRRPRGK